MDIDPNEWVMAWQTFVKTTPVAAIAATLVVIGLVGTLFAQGIVVPIIRAWKGKNGKSDAAV